jgi:hypothetical protein
MARPITRSNSDLPTTKSKEIILPDLPDQRRPRFKQQLDDEYESQSDLVLENLPEIQETEMNPDESAFADSVNPTENEITALISEIRIPAPLIERFQDFRLSDLIRLNNTTQENCLFEISRIQQRQLPIEQRGESVTLAQLAEQRLQQQQPQGLQEGRTPDTAQAGQPDQQNLEALGASGGGGARSGRCAR